MNLTKEIEARKTSFDPKVSFSNGRIEINRIGIEVDYPVNFIIAKKSAFDDLIADFEFPENTELNKKDRAGFLKEIFEPIFTLTSKENNRPIIACYLFNVHSLKGNSNLNIRSITKFELMWAEHFVESRNNQRVNVKRIVTNEINGSLSENYWFLYKSKSHNSKILSRLRVLNLEINDYVLTFYIVDDEQKTLTTTELETFINGIKKTNANKG